MNFAPLDPDDFDGYEPEVARGGGGGGGKKKEKHQGKKTQIAHREALIEASQRNMTLFEKKHPEISEVLDTSIRATLFRILEIDEDVVGVPNLQEYIQWVYQRLHSDEKPAIRSECTSDFQITSGAGGQNRNKVETGVRLVHNHTGIRFLEGNRASQDSNRSLAEERMGELIKQHLEKWSTYIMAKKGDIRKIMVKKIREELAGLIPKTKMDDFNGFCRMMARLPEDPSLDIDDLLKES